MGETGRRGHGFERTQGFAGRDAPQHGLTGTAAQTADRDPQQIEQAPVQRVEIEEFDVERRKVSFAQMLKEAHAELCALAVTGQYHPNTCQRPGPHRFGNQRDNRLGLA